MEFKLELRLEGEESQSLNELESLLEKVELTDGVKEKWGWAGGKSKTYTLKEAYKVLISELSCETNRNWLRAWHKSILSKVSLLAWRLFQDRIVSKTNLSKIELPLKLIYLEEECLAKSILTP